MTQHQDHHGDQEQPRPTLRAYPDPHAGCWVVDHQDAPDAAEVRQLFGTTLIPAAFTLDANPFDVGMALARLNPGHRIVVEQATRYAGISTDRDDTRIGQQLAEGIRQAVYGKDGH